MTLKPLKNAMNASWHKIGHFMAYMIIYVCVAALALWCPRGQTDNSKKDS